MCMFCDMVWKLLPWCYLCPLLLECCHIVRVCVEGCQSLVGIQNYTGMASTCVLHCLLAEPWISEGRAKREWMRQEWTRVHRILVDIQTGELQCKVHAFIHYRAFWREADELLGYRSKVQGNTSGSTVLNCNQTPWEDSNKGTVMKIELNGRAVQLLENIGNSVQAIKKLFS